MTYGTGLGFLSAFMLFSYDIPYERSLIGILVSLIMYYIIDKGLNDQILRGRVKILIISGVFLLSWMLLLEKHLELSEMTRLCTFMVVAVFFIAYNIIVKKRRKNHKAKNESSRTANQKNTPDLKTVR